jgi:diguanylate cyclase (GGDEF)-like protein/PAS domain S-box-containing protein
MDILLERAGELAAHAALMPGAIGLAGTAVMTAVAFGLHRRAKAGAEELGNLRELIENLYEGVYRSAPDGRQLSANRSLVALNGYESEAELIAAATDISTEWYVEPGRREAFRAALKRTGKVENFVSEIYRHKTRERIWISESARMVCDKHGAPLYYEGSVRDITETMARLHAEELLQKLSNQVPGGLFQFSRSSGGGYSISYMSSGFRRLTGYAGDLGRFDDLTFAGIVHPDDLTAFMETFRQSGMSMQPWDHEFRVVIDTETERWLRITAAPEAVHGSITWHGYLSDISVRKKHEMEIEKLAFYDPLTGLPNRRMFIDRMNWAIAGCAEGDHGALLFIDLDDFKALNDTRGHDTGDAYLAMVAQRLLATVGASGTVARIGGDEFVVILERLGSERQAADSMALLTATGVNAALRAPFDLSGTPYSASASIGVVVFDESEERADEVLKAADIAMYQAKAAGRDGVVLSAGKQMHERAPTAASSRRGPSRKSAARSR